MTKEQEHEKLNKPFEISSICRLDLVDETRTKEMVLSIPDENMKYIASKMADLMQEGYWEALEAVLEDFLPYEESKPPKRD